MGMLNNPIYRIKIHREAMEIEVSGLGGLGPPWLCANSYGISMVMCMGHVSHPEP